MISVCMATHNGGHYIKQQLNSIITQLSTKDEIIISDDGSTDDTIEQIRQFNDSRIKIFHFSQQKNYSKKWNSNYYYASANFCNALNHANGDVIFLSDQDDVWKENKVSICESYLNQYDMICHNFSIINEDGEKEKEKYLSPMELTHLCFFNALKLLPFRGCCFVFKRKVLECARPFPSNLFLHDCWIGMCGIYKGYRYGYIDESLIEYRRHFQNVSSLDPHNSLLQKIYYRGIMLKQLILHNLL